MLWSFGRRARPEEGATRYPSGSHQRHARQRVREVCSPAYPMENPGNEREKREKILLQKLLSLKSVITNILERENEM
jgi:hypothetical protein